MPCYYCSRNFADSDIVVELELQKATAQENGGVLFEDKETVYVHQGCLGAP